MLSVDEKIKSVIIFYFQGKQNLEAHQRSIKSWEKVLDKQQKVVVIRVFLDSESLEHAPGVGKTTRAWLKDSGGENIRNYVAAMINIVANDAYQQMTHLNVEAVFGVPGGIFSDVDSAMIWLRENLVKIRQTSLDIDFLNNELKSKCPLKIANSSNR